VVAVKALDESAPETVASDVKNWRRLGWDITNGWDLKSV
jgi:hypothetical protein